MARTRSIKPGFFDNELLGNLPPLTRLLFIGLWCQADRDGRLEDRPRKLKKTILGYDDLSTEDLDEMLGSLADNGFIIRYDAGGENYIQVVNFKKHQNPHMKEKPSEIPAPPGMEDGLPIKGEEPTEKGKGAEKAPKGGEKPGDKEGQKEEDRTPYAKIMALYHEICTSYPKIVAIDGKRRQAVGARWKNYQTIEAFRAVFMKAEASAFMKGTNDKGWKADFDWMMAPTNMAKILEGRYDEGRWDNAGTPGSNPDRGDGRKGPAQPTGTIQGFKPAD